MHFPTSVRVALVASFATQSLADSFQIYGYGPKIGGLTIFSSGGNAFIGDYKLANDSEAAPVIFTPDTSSGAWIGTPNTTEFTSGDVPSWSNYTFAVPGPSSSTRNVRFLNGTSNDTSLITTGFGAYGTFVFVSGDSGEMQMLWSCMPSDIDGVYSLAWNVSSDDTDYVPLTLKKTPPSNTLLEDSTSDSE